MKPNVCRYGGTGHIYINVGSQQKIVWACAWCKTKLRGVK